ncbi:MAG TPA: caspase family protein [bacterium]|nr:caspase family protein [bacterium]HMW34749.1 caspase family protein [bacterium]HNB09854.1 caspase family protein [bacterium]HNI10230.1 caspase family protein [bacterium]HNL25638.1 caspase family protein [bacterium]
MHHTRYLLLKVMLFLLFTSFANAQHNVRIVIPSHHTLGVTCFWMTEDGRYAVTGSKDNTLKLWDIHRGREIYSRKGFTNFNSDGVLNFPMSVHISSDQRLAAWGDNYGNVSIWDLDSDSIVHVIMLGRSQMGGNLSIRGLQFGSDNRTVLVIAEYAVKMYDAMSGAEIGIFCRSEEKITRIAVHGQTVLTGDRKGTVRMWDFSTQSEIKVLRDGNNQVLGQITDICISNDGLLAAAGTYDKKLFVFDLNEKKTKSEINIHKKHITALCFAERNQLMSASYDGLIFKTDIVNGITTPLTDKDLTSKLGAPTVLGYSANKKILLCGTEWNTSMVLLHMDGDSSTAMLGRKTEPAMAIFTDPDEERIIVGYKSFVSVWSLTYGKPQYNYAISPVRHYAFNPNRRLLAAAIGDTIHILNIVSNSVINQFRTSDEDKTDFINALRFSHDGQTLAVGGLTGYDRPNLKIFDLTNPNKYFGANMDTHSVHQIQFFKDGSLMIGGYNKCPIWWNWQTKKIKKLYAGPGSINYSIALSDDEKTAFFGFYIKNYLMDVNTGRFRQSFVMNGTVRSALLPSDNKSVLGACYNESDPLEGIMEWDLDSGKKIGAYRGHFGQVNQLNFINKEQFFLSAGNDGSVRLWNRQSKKEIAKFIGFDQGNGWVTVVDNGYYMATKNITDHIYYSSGKKIYNFDQFDLQYNRPDIVLERLGKAPPELIRTYKNAYLKRLQKMGFDPVNFESERSFNVPEITIPDLKTDLIETQNDTYTFSVHLKDKLYALDRLFVEVNGVPLYGVRGKSIKAENMLNSHQTIKVTLSEGRNIIRASVLNTRGVESVSASLEVYYRPHVPTKPVLYVVAIGVSQFIDSNMNLTYAAKDAEDMASLFSVNKDAYADVVIQTLTNSQATRNNIVKTKNLLMKSTVNDEVLLFVASHGLLDDQLNYYIATHDVDFNRPSFNGLSYDELESLTEGIAARKKLMLIDACHSGEVDKEETVLTNVAVHQESKGVSSRGFKTLQNKNSVGLINSFELMKALFADLRRGTGTIVISSAAGKEYAFESEAWKNGVFTYSLIEGLKSKNADTNQDRSITVSELRDYVTRRVSDLTQGKQNPTSRSENLESDFKIW